MAAESFTDLLIIGAGPFGLATAARCLSHNLDHTIVGAPLSFWRNQMPEGMYLRLGYDWHLCPDDRLTFRAYLAAEALDVELPLSLGRFIDYGDWFVRQAGINVKPKTVLRLMSDPKALNFVAEMDDGSTVLARTVLCTPGLGYFRFLPAALVNSFAPGHGFHSADFSKLDTFARQRCLIIGGRQSAFELAALIAEHGAETVHVVLRHPTPAFTDSDLDSWVPADLQQAEREPGWFRAQPPERRLAIQRRFWLEGRAKLEPWLAPRLKHPAIAVIPNSEVESIDRVGAAYRARLRGESASAIDFDRGIFATGFRIDLSCVPYLSDLAPQIAQAEGFPELTAEFESRTLPGAFFSGVVATRDFGPYVGFVPGCGFAARTIVDALQRRLSHVSPR